MYALWVVERSGGVVVEKQHVGGSAKVLIIGLGTESVFPITGAFPRIRGHAG